MIIRWEPLRRLPLPLRMRGGGVFSDTVGKVWDSSSQAWVDAWGGSIKWIKSVQTNYNNSNANTVTFNSDGSITMTGIYVNTNAGLRNTAGIAIDNSKYGFKGMVVRVTSNETTDPDRCEVFACGYDNINNLKESVKGVLLFGKQWNTLNTDIDVNFVNGTVSGTRYSSQYLTPLTGKYIVIFPCWNGSPTAGAYANATIKILNFYK